MPFIPKSKNPIDNLSVSECRALVERVRAGRGSPRDMEFYPVLQERAEALNRIWASIGEGCYRLEGQKKNELD